MNSNLRKDKRLLLETINKLTAESKGILAADESTNTIGKRLNSIDVQNNHENRKRYRKMLFSTKDLEKYISGVILYEETFYDEYVLGTTFSEYLKQRDIVPGIKVDQGLVSIRQYAVNDDDEKITKGLDTLNERCMDYYKNGARFTKWRCVFKIGDNLPSLELISLNIKILTEFAKISQNNNLVPIVEPEILMEGSHNINKCQNVTEDILRKLFKSLLTHDILLEGMILKVNMIKNGTNSKEKADLEEIVSRTIWVLKNSVPERVAGIFFLSGGISESESTSILCNINQKLRVKPWSISFSYGRALQHSVLRIWKGDDNNMNDARDKLLERSRANSLAVLGIAYKITNEIYKK